MEQADVGDKEEKRSPWTVHDARVNLAALLNDPRKTRRDYDLFTKTWGESFKDLPPGASVSKSLRVPNITEAHFRDHLGRTGDKFLRHQSQYTQEEAGDGDEKKHKDIFKSKFDFRRKSFLPPQNYAVYALQQQKKVQAATRQALDNIPKLFLRPEFALEDPHTFNSVLHFSASSGSSDSHSNPKPSKHSVVKHEMSSSKLLQEKLSHYLDMVEVAIVRQISIQSDAFFDAMTSHEDLNDYLTKMLAGVHQLRIKITSIRDNINKKSFEVVHLHCQRRNRAVLLDKLRTMITVHQAQPTIQLLLSTTEYAGALDLIETTQEVLKRELAGLHCFRHLGSQLSEMESVIGHMMAEELSSCIQNDLHRPLKEGPLTLNPHHLTAIALGLLRRKQLDFVEQYREEVKFAVKAIIKTTVMDAVIAAEEYLSPEECKDDDNVQTEGQEDEEGSPKERTESLAERMRLLTFEEWIILLSNIFSNLTLFLRRVCSFLSVIVNVACVSTSPVVRRSISGKLKNSQEAANSGTSSGETNHSGLSVNSVSGHVEESTENGQMALPDPLPNPPIGNQEHSDVTDNVWDDMDQYEAQLMESAVTNLNQDDGVVNGNETVQNVVKDGRVAAKAEGDTDSGSLHDDSPSPDSYGIATSRDILLSEEEHNELMESICENLVWTADFAHDRCVKVIIAKNKNSSLEKLTSSEFLSLAQSIEKYLADTEEVTFGSPPEDGDESTQYFAEYFSAYYGTGSRGGGVLRGVLQSQASRFITRFHEERRNKLSLILDNETWKQSEVPTELAALLRKLSNNHTPEGKNEVTVNGTSTTKALSVLTLDGTEYAVVGTVLLLLKMVSEYISCADDLPASTPDLVTRVSELLTLFNSRTCQLVLGAGALQLAGLKTISTRNLGLASRCLQLVLYLMPSIQQQFKDKLLNYCQSSTKSKHLNVLKHFAHVIKDYEDHITEIDSKLVTIMDSAMENNLSKWQVKAPTPSEEFRTICRQIAKLHEMIADLLPEDQIGRLLLEIHLRFKKLLRRKLQQYNVRNNGSPKHGLVMSDVAFYQGSVRELKIFEGVDLKMDSLWT